jgi:(p)ppGpp synthase/HD superfamily hydrolase
MWNPDLYDETLHFAASAHEGQFVPGKNYSYVVHLVGVCMEVMRAAIIEEVDDPNLAMQCALLHDTMEETALTSDILIDRFGKEVTEAVKALTKNPDIPKKRRLEDCLKRIIKLKREIWMVKLADRISNLKEPPEHWDNDKKKDYLEGSILIHTYLKKGSPYLAARLSDKIYAYKKYLIS